MGLHVRTPSHYDRPTPVMVFRIAARSFFLTYPQCGLLKEEVLKQLKAKFDADIDEYIIATEKHEDGHLHLHVFLRFERKVNVTNKNKLDLVEAQPGGGPAKWYHGNYQAARSAKAVREYAQKDGDYISGGIKVDKDLDDWTIARTQAMDGDPKGAFAYLGETHARDTLMRGKEIRYNLLALSPPAVYVQPEWVKQWEPPPSLTTALDLLGRRTVVISGPAGIGKTLYARSLSGDQPHHFVTSLDSLRSLSLSSGEYILFDDLTYSHLPWPEVIKIVDCEQPRSVHCRYSNAEVPASMKKIMLTNCDTPEELFGEKAWTQNEAVSRRVKWVRVETNLWEKEPQAVAPIFQGGYYADGYNPGGGGKYGDD